LAILTKIKSINHTELCIYSF